MTFQILDVMNSIKIIDRKRKKIMTIENGIYADITEKCKKAYEKEKEKSNKLMTCIYYEILQSQSDANSYNILLVTDDQKEFDKKLFEIQKKQLEDMLNFLNYNVIKLEKDTQYYTYELSNM